jgi:hypothetical protein
MDLDAIRETLAHAESMVEFYDRDLIKKTRENAAMKAADLPAPHSDYMIRHDTTSKAKFARFADALRAVLAHFGADQAEAA